MDMGRREGGALEVPKQTEVIEWHPDIATQPRPLILGNQWKSV